MAWWGTRIWGGGGGGKQLNPAPPWLLPASPLSPTEPLHTRRTPPVGDPPGAGGGRWQRWRGQDAFPGTRAHLHADGGRGWNSNRVGGGGDGGTPGAGAAPSPPSIQQCRYQALSITTAPCLPKPTLGVQEAFFWVVGHTPPSSSQWPAHPVEVPTGNAAPAHPHPPLGTPTSARPCSLGIAPPSRESPPHPCPVFPAGSSLSPSCPLPGLWAAGRGRRRWRAGGTGIWCALGGSPGFGSSPCPSFPSQHP